MGSAKMQTAQDTQMMNSHNKNKRIPDRTSPGNTRSASSIQHQGNDDKSTTGERMKIRYETYIGSWNIRTFRDNGKLEELTNEMKIYKWNIIGLSEIRKNVLTKYKQMKGIYSNTFAMKTGT